MFEIRLLFTCAEAGLISRPSVPTIDPPLPLLPAPPPNATAAFVTLWTNPLGLLCSNSVDVDVGVAIDIEGEVIVIVAVVAVAEAAAVALSTIAWRASISPRVTAVIAVPADNVLSAGSPFDDPMVPTPPAPSFNELRRVPGCA